MLSNPTTIMIMICVLCARALQALRAYAPYACATYTIDVNLDKRARMRSLLRVRARTFTRSAGPGAETTSTVARSRLPQL